MAKEYLVNRNIKKLIDDADKRPSAVADRAGISRDKFSKIIHCKRPVFADEVLPIAKAMGVDVEELFRENESA